jgi:hypothetical protein
MSATARSHRAPRFEVRAFWFVGEQRVESQPLAQFDQRALHARPPDGFGVYETYGANLEDYTERATAETHCAQLNGEPS